jgi:hypothetical protein
MKLNGIEFTPKELAEAIRIVGEGDRKEFKDWYVRTFPFPNSQTQELIKALDEAYDSIKSGEFQKALKEQGFNIC